MKIDNSINQLPSQSSPAAPARPVPAQAPATTVRTPDPMGAQVALSGVSSRVAQAGEGYNAARVAEIRQAIAEGRFQINPERIADGLLDSVREFLADRRPSNG